VGSTFNPPKKSRVAEAWAVVGIVVVMMVLIWLAV
jgi:hypothetical protein